MASDFFGRQRECRFYTVGCGNKMAVSVTGHRAVNELGDPVIPGMFKHQDLQMFDRKLNTFAYRDPQPQICKKLN